MSQVNLEEWLPKLWDRLEPRAREVEREILRRRQPTPEEATVSFQDLEARVLGFGSAVETFGEGLMAFFQGSGRTSEMRATVEVMEEAIQAMVDAKVTVQQANIREQVEHSGISAGVEAWRDVVLEHFFLQSLRLLAEWLDRLGRLAEKVRRGIEPEPKDMDLRLDLTIDTTNPETGKCRIQEKVEALLQTIERAKRQRPVG